jgi:hypothetical protein
MQEPKTVTADVLVDAILATRHVKERHDVTFAEPIRRQADGWFTAVDLPAGAARGIATDDREMIAAELGVLTCQVLLAWVPDEPRRLGIWVGDQPETWASTHDAHTWFNLTYSNYLVLHRTFLQSMPDWWQQRFVTMLIEFQRAFAHVEQADAYIVTAATECTYSDLNERDMAELGITRPDASGGGEDKEDDDRTYYDRDGSERDAYDSVLAPRPGGDPVPHYQRGRTRIEPRLP